MGPELPQEFNRTLLYGSVIREPDSGRYRMWYLSSTQTPEKQDNTLYAESDDGYHWRKPELDIVPGGFTGFRGLVDIRACRGEWQFQALQQRLPVRGR